MALTIVTASDTYDLTTLAQVKLELGFTDTTNDELLAQLIHEQSEVLASCCHRVFAEETVSETFDLAHWGQWNNRTFHGQERPELILSRFPVTDVASVTIDERILDTTEYRVDGAKGLLFRVNANGRIHMWRGTEATVVYTGGYELLGTLPRDIESAALTLLKSRWYATQRDPAVKSEAAIGVLTTVWDNSYGQSSSGYGYPPDVQRAIARYTDFRATIA